MQNCPHCHSNKIIKKNFYFLKHSRGRLRRYLCHQCRKSFSSRTFSPTYKQKKPYLNDPIFELLVSGNSQRRVARLLACSKKTVSLKLLWLNKYAPISSFSKSDGEHIQIDEMEKIEHTKLKPLTIPICVNSNFKTLGVSAGKIKAAPYHHNR